MSVWSHINFGFFWLFHWLTCVFVPQTMLSKNNIYISVKPSPVFLLQGHVLLIDRARQFWLARENDVMLEDHGLDKIIDLWLPSNSIISIHAPQQAGAEANGQVVGLHHVFVAVLRHTGERRAHKKNDSFLHGCSLFLTITNSSSVEISLWISHMGLSCSLLIEESEKVAQHDEERTWESRDNCFNLGSFLCLPLDFCLMTKRMKNMSSNADSKYCWIHFNTQHNSFFLHLFDIYHSYTYEQLLHLHYNNVCRFREISVCQGQGWKPTCHGGTWEFGNWPRNLLEIHC